MVQGQLIDRDVVEEIRCFTVCKHIQTSCKGVVRTVNHLGSNGKIQTSAVACWVESVELLMIELEE